MTVETACQILEALASADDPIFVTAEQEEKHGWALSCYDCRETTPSRLGQSDLARLDARKFRVGYYAARRGGGVSRLVRRPIYNMVLDRMRSDA